ncbi:MAG TPA: CotH kinase family protein [Polyangiaceae bacterium]|nr:CotH kinase family protein [Polyangiaceae bacterium]
MSGVSFAAARSNWVLGFVVLGLACSSSSTSPPTGGSGGAAGSLNPSAGNPASGATSGAPAAGAGATPGTTPGTTAQPSQGGAVNPGGGAPSAGSGGSVSMSGAPSTAGMPAGGGGGTGGTGGMPSTKPAPTLIGDVTFSTPSQAFKGELKVELATAVASAEIRYTTDGTLPTATSQVYAGAITLTATTQLRAQAFVAGAPSGAPSTGLYIARTFDATSDVPIVLMDSYGSGKPDKSTYKSVAVMVFEPVNGTASVASLPTIAARGGYHLRGQSSAGFEQAPYKIEFWDNADKDLDYPVMGMPADSDWALIPPYYDRSLIRNPFTYTLGKEMGLEAPRTVNAEVYLNWTAGRPMDTADYQGIYWFSETIKNNKVRTNLKELKEDDNMLPQISGGYIFKFDQLATEEPTLKCTGSNPISSGFGGPPRGGGMGGMTGAGMTGTCWTDLELVDPDKATQPQLDWITQYIQTFHNSLHAMPIGDYAQYMDVPSFVDYFIVNELTRNVDSYVRSAFYHKDRDGKIVAGPLWDYNFALAVGANESVNPTAGFMYNGNGSGGRNVNNWYPKLMADAAFKAQIKARWTALRQNLLSEASLDERITKLSTPMKNAVVRDYAKWSVDYIYKKGQGSSFIKIAMPNGPTYDDQIQALRTYVKARVAYMDTEIAKF